MRSATHPQHKWSTPCQVVPRAINESVQAQGGLRDMSQHVLTALALPIIQGLPAHTLNDGMIRRCCPNPGSPFSRKLIPKWPVDSFDPPHVTKPRGLGRGLNASSLKLETNDGLWTNFCFRQRLMCPVSHLIRIKNRHL